VREKERDHTVSISSTEGRASSFVGMILSWTPLLVFTEKLFPLSYLPVDWKGPLIHGLPYLLSLCIIIAVLDVAVLDVGVDPVLIGLTVLFFQAP
jgi:hypothetical protein